MLVETKPSSLRRRGKEYLFKTSLVNKPLSFDNLSSAFLFSIARKSASNPTVNKNHGELGRELTDMPAIALSKKPDAIEKISKIGFLLR